MAQTKIKRASTLQNKTDRITSKSQLPRAGFLYARLALRSLPPMSDFLQAVSFEHELVVRPCKAPVNLLYSEYCYGFLVMAVTKMFLHVNFHHDFKCDESIAFNFIRLFDMFSWNNITIKKALSREGYRSVFYKNVPRFCC